MAKQINTINDTSNYLIIQRQAFKTMLLQRIAKGNELLQRPINSQEDFEKFNDDCNQWGRYNFELLSQSFESTNNKYVKSYNSAGHTFLGQLGVVQGNPTKTAQNLLNNKIKELKNLESTVELLKSLEETPASQSATEQKTHISKSEVFIVHGHDELAKNKAARFIEKLGLEAIILHEKTSSGRTIIEKIEEYSNVGFGIILYTPCDLGNQRGMEINLNPRARQNVVFEHGFLIGKIGRKNVCALVKENVETPNDMSGIVFVKMDDEDSWKYKVAKELKASGYHIDLNLID